MLTICAALALAAASTAPLGAQQAEALGDGQLSLDAAEGVEWRRQERIFVAEGAAVARQGDVTLRADRLVASYRDKPGGGFEIFRVDAEGAVSIQNGDDLAKGVRAAFDLDGRAITLSGPGASYSGKVGGVTASDSIAYDLNARTAVANGGAEVVAQNGRLTADRIEAQFDEDQTLTSAVAAGGVSIRTANETIRSRQAEYDAKRQRAVARGGVRIQRGDNLLTGEVATVDLASGISRISGGASGGRVRGLVFPKAQ